MSNWLESIQIEKLEELLKTDDYCKKGKLDRMDEDGMTLLHRSILANRIEIVSLVSTLFIFVLTYYIIRVLPKVPRPKANNFRLTKNLHKS